MKKFKVAFRGLLNVVTSHKAVRIQFVLGFVTLITCLFLKLSYWEWLVIIILITMVIALEIINTAIELLCNKITTQYDVEIKKIKDIAAAAVLVSSIGALACFILILLQKGNLI